MDQYPVYAQPIAANRFPHLKQIRHNPHNPLINCVF